MQAGLESKVVLVVRSIFHVGGSSVHVVRRRASREKGGLSCFCTRHRTSVFGLCMAAMMLLVTGGKLQEVLSCQDVVEAWQEKLSFTGITGNVAPDPSRDEEDAAW
jgi:hypothetical protein